MTVSDLSLGGHTAQVFQDLSQTTSMKKEGSEQNYSLPDKVQVKYRRSFLCKCILTHQEQQYIIKGKRRQLKSLRSWNAWGSVWNTVYFSIILYCIRERIAAKPKRWEYQDAKRDCEESLHYGYAKDVCEMGQQLGKGGTSWGKRSPSSNAENRGMEKMGGKRTVRVQKQRTAAVGECSSMPRPQGRQLRTR